MKKMILKAGREKSLLRRHPWVFSGAVKSAGGAVSGDVVEVSAEDGRFLAWATYSERSQIVARAISFIQSDVIDDAFFAKRIGDAVQRRKSLMSTTDSCRLVHAESDYLPGVIADRYGDVVVMQLLTAGMEPRRDFLAQTLLETTGAKTVYERSDADVRALEGLEVRNGLILGEPLSGEVMINEAGLRYAVDIAEGHKTGFYLDQRDSRALTRAIAEGKDVLNCFCYTGGMSIAALVGGATSVLSVDSSGPALETAQRNVAANQVDSARAEWWEADVFTALRKLRDMGRQFDLIILDPPKFAPTAHHAEKAARAYKDINLLGCKLLRAGGQLMTFSCSGGVSTELFQKIVAGAALDAGIDAQILRRLQGPEDHPVSMHFPEGDYLKGLLLRRA